MPISFRELSVFDSPNNHKIPANQNGSSLNWRGFLVVGTVASYSHLTYPEKTLEELQRILAAKPRPSTSPLPQSVDPIRDVARRLGDKKVNQLVAAYQSGTHTTELMAEYGISKSAVLRILKQHHIPMRRQPMTTQKVAKASQLYKAGKSLAQVGKELDIPKQSVRNALLQAGVRLRPSTRTPASAGLTTSTLP